MNTQPEPTLVELIHYNNWANAKVFNACQELTEERLAAFAPGTYGSIHAIRGNIVAAEADYINRLSGDGPQPPFRLGLSLLSSGTVRAKNKFLGKSPC